MKNRRYYSLTCYNKKSGLLQEASCVTEIATIAMSFSINLEVESAGHVYVSIYMVQFNLLIVIRPSIIFKIVHVH